MRPGQPLGRHEIDETRRRLTALGIFRRIELREFGHGAADRRDVVVVVEEAPATTIGYGGRMEASQRLHQPRKQDVYCMLGRKQSCTMTSLH